MEGSNGHFALLCISLLYFASVHNLFYLINNVIKDNIVKQLSHIRGSRSKSISGAYAAFSAGGCTLSLSGPDVSRFGCASAVGASEF